MLSLVFAVLFASPVSAEEVVLRNDVDPSGGTYTPANSSVLWAGPTECIISVLTPEPEDLPLEVHTIQLLFTTSNTAGLDRSPTVELGIQRLPESQAGPTGRGSWAWGEQAFTVTVTSDYLNELVIDDPGSSFFPLELNEGKIAVWICAPADNEGGGPWPSTSATDVSGVLVHRDSPSEGNYIYSPEVGVVAASSYGIRGSFVIRALAGEGSGNVGDDTGNGGDDTGDWNPGSGDFYVQSITPSSVPQGESVDVVIIGDGFEPGTDVRIGGISLTGTDVVNAETIMGRTPTALPAGLHDVEVILPNDESDYLAGAFEVTGGCGCATSGAPNSGAPSPAGAFAGLALLGLMALRRRS